MKLSDPSLKPFQLLEALSDAPSDGLGITELSEKSGLSKSTAFRLANALADAGYLIRNASTKRYKLGYRLLRIVSSVARVCRQPADVEPGRAERGGHC